MDQPTSNPPHDHFQDLVNEFRQALTVATAAMPPPPPPALPPLPSVVSHTPEVNPTPYSGDPDACEGFLLQCSLALEMQPQRFPTERSRIASIIFLLSGRALQWAGSVWNHPGCVTESINNFVAHFKEVFGIPEGDSVIQTNLYTLRQGKSSITQYALRFRTLAAASGWNEPALITTFRQGLEPSLHLHLSSYDDSIGLERFIQSGPPP